jgi:pyruvate/2-oxoglutarate dehydrogenase complex dihydrolipoamide acyltransferase (E2) component
VLSGAGRLGWQEFATAYARSVADVRAGKVEDVQASVLITSLGAFGVEVATPIVVPPSMATLFVGKSHERMVNDGGVIYPAEVVTLSLTFDHRVVNGAAAAAFLQEVKTRIAEFAIPAGPETCS